MKKVTLVIVLCVVMGTFAGCQDALTPAQVQALSAQQDVLQQEFDSIQTVATELAGQLADTDILDRETVANIVKLNHEADRIQLQLATIAQALTNVPLTGDTTVDWIALLQAGNVASGGFNPYAVPVGVGLSLLSGVLAWFARRNASEAAAAKLKYQAHKQGVEKTMKEVSASVVPEVKAVEAELYTNIGEARSNLNI